MQSEHILPPCELLAPPAPVRGKLAFHPERCRRDKSRAWYGFRHGNNLTRKPGKACTEIRSRGSKLARTAYAKGRKVKSGRLTGWRWELAAGVPQTRYAIAEKNVHIAYQAFGGGPHDLVFLPPFLTNVEVWWELPVAARFY